MTANVPVVFLLKARNDMVNTQLSLIEESYFNKKSEKQLRSRYDQLFLLNMLLLAGLLSIKVTSQVYHINIVKTFSPSLIL